MGKKGTVFVHIEHTEKGILGLSSQFLDSLLKEPTGDKLLDRLTYDDYPSSKFQTKKKLLRTLFIFSNCIVKNTCIVKDKGFLFIYFPFFKRPF